MPDGREGDNLLDVDTVCYTILEKDLDANVAGTNLESSQELILESFISPLIH
jgi:hypothetical protein